MWSGRGWIFDHIPKLVLLFLGKDTYMDSGNAKILGFFLPTAEKLQTSQFFSIFTNSANEHQVSLHSFFLFISSGMIRILSTSFLTFSKFGHQEVLVPLVFRPQFQYVPSYLRGFLLTRWKNYTARIILLKVQSRETTITFLTGSRRLVFEFCRSRKK